MAPNRYQSRQPLRDINYYEVNGVIDNNEGYSHCSVQIKKTAA